MVKHLLLFSLVISAGIAASAQSDVYVYNKDSSQGFITVIKDPRFDELAARQAEINKKAQRYITKRAPGWRIQVSNTQNRDEANNVKAELLKRFPDQKTYLLYQAPNFRVRIGNFAAQKDAMQLRKAISALYPGKGIYIVQDVIEVAPPADDEEDSAKE